MPLSDIEASAAHLLVDRVLGEIDADLVEASVFGSKARGEARADSDLDLLLVFRVLLPDREPHASQTERIAGAVARATRVPLNVWTVSLDDFRQGRRTPMLVDASRDAIPLWTAAERPIGAVQFTASDAVRCVTALLDRVVEGGAEFAQAVDDGVYSRATRRGRDDLVRLCTAFLLLRGVTRPRRADAIREYARVGDFGWRVPGSILDWGIASFGMDGADEERPVPIPAGGVQLLADSIRVLRLQVTEELYAFLDGTGHRSA